MDSTKREKTQRFHEVLNGDQEVLPGREMLQIKKEKKNKVHIQEETKELFQLFDVDSDGRISANDLHAVIASVGKGISLEDVKEIIDCLDGNGDGHITFAEFVNFIEDDLKHKTAVEDLKDAFDVFDANKDGFITPEEIQTLFTKLGDAVSYEEATEILSSGDFDQDGLIDFEDFKRFSLQFLHDVKSQEDNQH
ncbi:neo-calmodulin-like [Hydractinia symbiolongicarpus]|uniref:neo-calmodulin-like n=1 Tax=Hydractinia symbiolongicarpus TaxID=13093 RepID=UPI00254A994E|nr:neo-calmodulin-like [Hydractinia symbiolongicarpus]